MVFFRFFVFVIEYSLSTYHRLVRLLVGFIDTRKFYQVPLESAFQGVSP